MFRLMKSDGPKLLGKKRRRRQATGQISARPNSWRLRRVGVRFYTIADQSYFLGLVAMVNSLRFHGHWDPVTVLDLGLLPNQRAVLREQCEFVLPPDGVRPHPWMIA